MYVGSDREDVNVLKFKIKLFFFIEKKDIVVKNEKQDCELMFSLLIK